MSDLPPPIGPSNDVFVSIVIPAFDEVGRIGNSVERVLRYLDSRRYSSELIVVLDGGRPGAEAEIQAAAAGRGNVVVLDNGRNRGKGFSVRRGVAASRGSHVLFIDADLSLPIEGADRFIEALGGTADVAIGSRALAESTEQGQRMLRRSLGRLFNWIVQRTVLPGIQDTQCGFKAFDGAVARKLFAAQTIDRFGFDLEVLRIARLRGYRIVEVPVACQYHSTSSVRCVRDGVVMLRDLFTILWRVMVRQYDDAR